MTPLLDARGIALGQRLFPADLISAGGELVGLVGPNGGGKTSLLRALARVEGAGGRVRVDDEDIDQAGETRRRRLVSFLPASREVAWPIMVRETIALGLGSVDAMRVDALIAQFELISFATRTIDTLSTGERARVLLARALAAGPRLVLLDEPLSNLDPFWVLRTLDLLTDRARRGASVLVALHDLALIDRFDRLLLLDGGKIVGDGPPGVLQSRLGSLFGIEPAASGWRISL